jgi:hypothetical protein
MLDVCADAEDVQAPHQQHCRPIRALAFAFFAFGQIRHDIAPSGARVMRTAAIATPVSDTGSSKCPTWLKLRW